jgi:transcriptional regulator with XRE-family HTH domain
MTGTHQVGGPDGRPTTLRILLGARLRRLREDRGFTRAEAGWEIRASESKISRLELGRVGFKERDVADLLTFYGVGDPERAALLARAREANTRVWWHAYSDIMPNWFQWYLGLEAAAALIRTYEVQFVPGLLQTEEYAKAVVRLGHGRAREEEVARRVGLRMERQQVLSRPNPPRLWVVVDETALRRPVGGPRVMRDQLEALIGITIKLPNVQLQVIPLVAGGHAAAGGSFTILRFPDEELPDVVYVEQLTSALYLDKREDVSRYAEAVDRLAAVEAAPPSRTADILDVMIGELDSTAR